MKLLRTLSFATATGMMLCQSAGATPINGTTDNCSIPGAFVQEHNFFGVDKHFTVNFTDRLNGGQIVASVDAGVIPAGQTVIVGVPPGAAVLTHCDVVNHSVAGAAGGGGNAIKLAHFIDTPDEAVAHRSHRTSWDMIFRDAVCRG